MATLQQKLIQLLEQTPATDALVKTLKNPHVEIPETEVGEKQTLLFMAGVYSDPARRKETKEKVLRFLSETGLQKTLDDLQPASTSSYQPKKK